MKIENWNKHNPFQSGIRECDCAGEESPASNSD